jgi:hypothetical protein
MRLASSSQCAEHQPRTISSVTSSVPGTQVLAEHETLVEAVLAEQVGSPGRNREACSAS